jgi:ADP-ribose pyrophosphatase
MVSRTTAIAAGGRLDLFGLEHRGLTIKFNFENETSMDQEELWAGKFLTVRKSGRWEYVSRTTGRPVVAIVAIDKQDHLILVEQFRPPIGSNVIELPAGLAGDIKGAEDEALLVAAQRELEEETGYTSQQWRRVTNGLSSAGLTDESTEVFAAIDVQQTSAGGGVSGENITLHRVPVKGLMQWLNQQPLPYDLKLLGAVYAALS